MRRLTRTTSWPLAMSARCRLVVVRRAERRAHATKAPQRDATAAGKLPRAAPHACIPALPSRIIKRVSSSLRRDHIRRQRKGALAVPGLGLLEPEAGLGPLKRPLDPERRPCGTA